MDRLEAATGHTPRVGLFVVHTFFTYWGWGLYVFESL